jgi:hypothetical protein
MFSGKAVALDHRYNDSPGRRAYQQVRVVLLEGEPPGLHHLNYLKIGPKTTIILRGGWESDPR